MTIAPPRSRISASPSLQPRNAERRLTAITRSQSSTLVPRSAKPAPMPTLSTTPSTAPACSNIAVTPSSVEASAVMMVVSPPISAAVASALAVWMSATTTEAPSRANSTDIARPLPIGGSSSPWSNCPPPTTSTRRPVSLPRPGASPRASSVSVVMAASMTTADRAPRSRQGVLAQVRAPRRPPVADRRPVPVVGDAPRLVLVPVAAAHAPDAVAQVALQIGVEALHDLRAHVGGARAAAAHRVEHLEHVVDLALEHEDDRVVPQVGVRAVEQEEVGEAAHGQPQVGLGPARPALVERGPAGADHAHRRHERLAGEAGGEHHGGQ